VKHETITTSSQLVQLCERLSAAEAVGFDTEFVSEDSYFPKLCLVQVVAPGLLAVIDPLAVEDVSAFWKMLAARTRPTIVHAGREELNFCLAAVGRPPGQLFDTQLAAGFVSHEYPSGYGGLVRKFLNETAAKGETRTDWRRRPLSDDQIDYALEDVRYLLPLRDNLQQLLQSHQREQWFADEMQSWMGEVQDARERLRWRKVSGISGMSSRSLAIVRELWMWRNKEAQRRNMPAKRVLRDDLVVELARRQSADSNKIRAIRGLSRHVIQNYVSPIAACIQRGLDLPASELPHKQRREMPSQLNILGQFLSPALNSICRSAQIANALVGTATDVRDLVAYRLDFGEAERQEPPALALGWRAEVVGKLIDELLAGKRTIRIKDPHSDHPLAFEPSQAPE
jgi:ribonuclease D